MTKQRVLSTNKLINNRKTGVCNFFLANLLQQKRSQKTIIQINALHFVQIVNLCKQISIKISVNNNIKLTLVLLVSDAL